MDENVYDFQYYRNNGITCKMEKAYLTTMPIYN